MTRSLQLAMCLFASVLFVGGIAGVVQAAGGNGTCKTEIHERKVGPNWVFEKIICLGTCPPVGGMNGLCTEVEVGSYVDPATGDFHKQITCGCVYDRGENEDPLVQYDTTGHGFACDGIKDINETKGTETGYCAGKCPGTKTCDEVHETPYTEGGVQKRRYECDCL